MRFGKQNPAPEVTRATKEKKRRKKYEEVQNKRRFDS